MNRYRVSSKVPGRVDLVNRFVQTRSLTVVKQFDDGSVVVDASAEPDQWGPIAVTLME